MIIVFLNTITASLMALTHVYFCYRIMDAKIEKRKQMVVISIYILAVIAALSHGIFEIALLRIAIANISLFTFICIIFKSKKMLTMMWMLFISYVGLMAETVVGSLYFALSLYNIFDLSDAQGMFGLAIRCVIILIKIITFYMVSRNFNKKHIAGARELTCLSIIMVSLLLLVTWLFRSLLTLDSDVLQIVLPIASVSMLVVLLSVFSLYNHMIMTAEERLQLQLESRTYQLTKEHTAQITSTYEKMSGLKHDLNNHFTAISGYLENDELDMLKDYVSKLAKNNTVPAIYSRNPVLNALISAKSEMAENNNIKFTVDVALPNPLPVSDIELCILVGNLLDNAFEAQEQTEQQHYVDLKIQAVDAYLMIACTNKARITDSFTSFSNLESTKINNENPEAHGIGTKQIQKIAEGTGGYVRYKNEGGEFEALVMLKL